MLDALGFGLGLTITVLYPILTAHVVDRMGSEKAVAISATLLFLYCVGAVLGPLSAAGLMTRFGDPMLFVQNAVLHLVLAAYVFLRMLVPERRVARKPEPAGRVEPADPADTTRAP